MLLFVLFSKVLVLLNDPYSLDLGRAESETWERLKNTDSSFIQMQYDLFNGQRHGSSAPLTVADDGIAPLSNDVAVPADSLGSSRRTLCSHRLELERFALSDNRSVIRHSGVSPSSSTPATKVTERPILVLCGPSSCLSTRRYSGGVWITDVTQ